MQVYQALGANHECSLFNQNWRDKTRDRRARRLAETIPALLKRHGLRQRIRNSAALIDIAEALFVNLGHAANWHRRVLVSRDTSHRNPLPNLLDALEALGFIRQWKAPCSPYGGITSQAEPLPPLLDALEPISAPEIAEQLRAVVEMRDSAGEPVTVPARALRVLSPPIKRLNRILSAVVVTLSGRRLVTPQVIRIFNGDLSHGGRWYHRLQNLSKAERASLLLDGEPVAELDFSALHPRLIYARERIDFPIHADPYASAGIPRKAMKAIWLQVMNDTSPRAAAAHLEGRQNPGRLAAYERHSADLKAWQETPLQSRTAPPIRPLCLGPAFEPFPPEIDVPAAIEALLEIHAPIAHTFNREGQALELQNTDARIAERVIARFVERGWPVLPVHDSFIVKARHSQALRSFMDAAFAAETGGFQCPIK
jgi:hypothetical protein